MEHTTLIRDRLHLRLTAKETRKVRPCILEYLADTGTKPEEVKLGVEFLKALLPYLQDSCSTYVGLTEKDLNTSSIAIK
jgi:hypothetical protein